MNIRAIVATTAVLTCSLMSVALRAEAPAPPGEEKGMADAKMKEECQAMMAKHEAMKAEMASLDAKLDALVVNMNAAKGDKKVDAMAAVINELAAQRKVMRGHMMAMGPQMMEHMMHHGDMAKSMSHCPMHSAAPQEGEPPTHH